MNMNQKGFANIILVVVIVILVGAVGYFAFVKKSEPIAQQPTPTQTTNPTGTPTSNPSLTPTAISETANWQTYRSEKYGFEVKYPQKFVLDENFYGQTEFSVVFGLPYNQVFGSNHPVYKSAPSLGVKVNRLGNGVTLESYVQSSIEGQGIYVERKMGETKVANTTAITTQSCNEGGKCFPSAYVAHGNLVFILIDEHGGRGSAPDIFTQALSTFKFIR